MSIKKSAPFYFKAAPPKADEASGVIRDIVLIQEYVGDDTDAYGDNFDEIFLDQLIAAGNGQTMGLKSRFGHPNMCDSTIGSYLGRYKNFRKSTNSDGKKVAVADLHLDPIAKNAPGRGDIYTYTLEMAKSNSDMCGNSICYFPADPELITEKDAEGNDIVRQYQRLKSFPASDIVDSPAATDNLFKDIEDMDLGEQVGLFLDQHPELLERIQKDESVLTQFLLKYFNNKKENPMAKTAAEKLKEAKLKEAADKKKLEKESKKSYDATNSGGLTVTISDENGDGKPSEGDMITNTETGEPISGETQFPDGSSVTSDDTGKITSVVEAAASNDNADAAQKEIIRLKGVETAHSKTIKQLEAQLATAKEALEVSDSALDSQISENLKLKEDLAKTKGTHVPKEGDEDFVKPEDPKEKLSLKERKEARKKEIESKNKK